jgi:hypothetical protein
MKKILVILGLVLMMAIAIFSLGIAYAGGIRGTGLLGIWFFLTFGIIVVLGQLIPASVFFASLIGTVISSFRGEEMPIRAT